MGQLYDRRAMSARNFIRCRTANKPGAQAFLIVNIVNRLQGHDNASEPAIDLLSPHLPAWPP